MSISPSSSRQSRVKEWGCFKLRRRIFTASMLAVMVASLGWGCYNLFQSHNYQHGIFTATQVCNSSDSSCLNTGTWVSDDGATRINSAKLGDDITKGAKVSAYHDTSHDTDQVLTTQGIMIQRWLPWSLAAGSALIAAALTIWSRKRPQDAWLYS